MLGAGVGEAILIKLAVKYGSKILDAAYEHMPTYEEMPELYERAVALYNFTPATATATGPVVD